MQADHDSRQERQSQGGAGPSFANGNTPEGWRTSAVQPSAAGRQAPGLMARAVSAFGHRVAELLNVCAAYLGIAVLVTLAMVFTIAPLRSQVSQMHQSLLAALRPD